MVSHGTRTAVSWVKVQVFIFDPPIHRTLRLFSLYFSGHVDYIQLDFVLTITKKHGQFVCMYTNQNITFRDYFTN